jgi:cardiolipin synthase
MWWVSFCGGLTSPFRPVRTLRFAHAAIYVGGSDFSEAVMRTAANPQTPKLKLRLNALGILLRPINVGRRRVGVAVLNLPNLITLARILMVPVVVWAIASREMQIAFLVFLIAGVSDAVDGFLAKRFDMTSELGAHLDPLADKVLIVSIYIALGITESIPRWVVILVVSRDILIVGGVMLAWFLGKPIRMKPVLVSKLNTVAQIVFACLVLASLAFGVEIEMVEGAVMVLVAALTLASVALYVREWAVHMSTVELER